MAEEHDTMIDELKILVFLFHDIPTIPNRMLSLRPLGFGINNQRHFGFFETLIARFFFRCTFAGRQFAQWD
jgi:hypothetical protein